MFIINSNILSDEEAEQLLLKRDENDSYMYNFIELSDEEIRITIKYPLKKNLRNRAIDIAGKIQQVLNG